ncbi:hypothetical protein HanRHA438_Chr07g0319631 [Helianthus annuus]|nr:hypothetical protein HanRHA438_Chr07g0319631 [Helianthus annuus]
MPPHSTGKRPRTPPRRAVWQKNFEERDVDSGVMKNKEGVGNTGIRRRRDKEEGAFLGFFYGLWVGLGSTQKVLWFFYLFIFSFLIYFSVFIFFKF